VQNVNYCAVQKIRQTYILVTTYRSMDIAELLIDLRNKYWV